MHATDRAGPCIAYKQLHMMCYDECEQLREILLGLAFLSIALFILILVTHLTRNVHLLVAATTAVWSWSLGNDEVLAMISIFRRVY